MARRPIISTASNLQSRSIEHLEVVVEGGGNQAPTDIALTGNTVAENAAGAVIGTLSTVDPDAGDTHTYAVSDTQFRSRRRPR